MANPYIIAHIKNLPLLADLPDEQLDWLAERIEVIRVDQNGLVFRQGQPAQGLFLLTNGECLLTKQGASGEQVLGPVHENQFVGEAALFQVYNERGSMRATRPSILLFLSRLAFQDVLLGHPELRPNINSQYASFGPQAPPQFQGHRPNEQMLLRQQRHAWVFWRGIMLPIAVGLALIVIAFLLSQTGLTLIILPLAVILPGAWIYYLYAEWQNDFIIVTDQRVIYTEQTILSFQSHTGEIPISAVHEVSYEIPKTDPFARIFHYGTVFIRTAGESGNMTLTVLANPENLQKLLLTYQEHFQQSADQQDRAAIGAAIDSFLKPDNQQSELPDPKTAPELRPAASQRPGLLTTRYVDGQGNIIYRKHLTNWSAHVMLPVGLALAALVLILIGVLNLANPLNGVEVVAGIFFILISALWFYWSDWDWRNDMIVIGQSTVRIIHKRPLWLQDHNEQFLLNQVDNVETARGGLINTLLNRGTVRVSLVGDDHPKEFRFVGHPAQVQSEIFERRAALIKQQDEAELVQQRQEIARYLDVYHERIQEQQNNNASYQAPPPGPAQDPRPPRVPRRQDD